MWLSGNQYIRGLIIDYLLLIIDYFEVLIRVYSCSFVKKNAKQSQAARLRREAPTTEL